MLPRKFTQLWVMVLMLASFQIANVRTVLGGGAVSASDFTLDNVHVATTTGNILIIATPTINGGGINWSTQLDTGRIEFTETDPKGVPIIHSITTLEGKAPLALLTYEDFEEKLRDFKNRVGRSDFFNTLTQVITMLDNLELKARNCIKGPQPVYTNSLSASLIPKDENRLSLYALAVVRYGTFPTVTSNGLARQGLK